MRPTWRLVRGTSALLLGLWFQAVSSAQVYTIDWFRIAGGGGTSTNGLYTVSGTLGQPEAGLPMGGGIFAITGGVQFESAGSEILPVPLRIVRLAQLVNASGVREVHITMAGTPGHVFQLQATSNLTRTITWADLGARATAPTEGFLEFIDAGPPEVRFYRIIESAGP